MNRKLHLLNRRRNNVLVARHVRAVSLRHVPHQYVCVNVKKEVQDVEKIETPVVEEKNKTVEEVNKVEVIKPVKKQPTAEEKKEQKRLEKQAKNQKAKAKKARKYQKKEEALNRLIDEPSNSLFLMMINPLLCMDRVADVDYATLSAGQRCVLNILKWIAFSSCIAMGISHLINLEPFGFARLNFTATANLAFKIAAYGFIFEYLITYLIKLACTNKTILVDRDRMVSICTIAVPFKIVMYVISACLIAYNTMIGYAFFFTAAFVSILLTGYGLNKTSLPHKRAMLALIAGIFVAMSVFGMYFTFIAKDIIQIFMNILNI